MNTRKELVRSSRLQRQLGLGTSMPSKHTGTANVFRELTTIRGARL